MSVANYDSYWDRQKREEIEKRRKEEEEQRQRDTDDIDGDINWAYSQMRIIEAYLEGALESGSASVLSDTDQKRIDKALVVTRTGLKMLKKVAKSRAPHLSTRAWKVEITDPAQH